MRTGQLPHVLVSMPSNQPSATQHQYSVCCFSHIASLWPSTHSKLHSLINSIQPESAINNIIIWPRQNEGRALGLRTYMMLSYANGSLPRRTLFPHGLRHSNSRRMQTIRDDQEREKLCLIKLKLKSLSLQPRLSAGRHYKQSIRCSASLISA